MPDAHGGQKQASGPLELESWVIANTRVLGTDLRCAIRATNALKHWRLHLALKTYLLMEVQQTCVKLTVY